MDIGHEEDHSGQWLVTFGGPMDWRIEPTDIQDENDLPFEGFEVRLYPTFRKAKKALLTHLIRQRDEVDYSIRYLRTEFTEDEARRR